MGEEVESPYFSTGVDEESKWCLRLYLKGINDNFKDYLSLYLYRKSGVEYKLDGQYSLSILNNKKEKFVEETEVYQYNKNYSSCGFPAFIKSDLVKDKANGLLMDDSLTFYCDITVVMGSVNISSESSTVQREFSNAKMLNHFEKFFLDKRFSDVKLLTSCGKELYAHKNILAARSPIFSAMFEHDMMERKLNMVEITDANYNVLKEMLRFIYADRVENIENMANELLIMADKYEIEGLKNMCEKVLCDTMSVDNVVEILIVSDRHNIGYLKSRAMNFIKAHINNVIDSEGFKSIVQTDILTNIIRAIIQQ